MERSGIRGGPFAVPHPGLRALPFIRATLRTAALLLAVATAANAANPGAHWLEEGRPGRNAFELITALQHAPEHGLDPDDYGLNALLRLGDERDPDSHRELARRLEQAFLDYARDLHRGRLDPGTADPDWKIPREPFDPEPLLDELSSGATVGEILARLPPPQAGYRHLQQVLTRYRDIAAAGGWPDIPAGPVLAERSRDKRVPTLRRHLELTGDLTEEPETEDPFWLDTALARAVRRFQARHALPETGKVDERTRAMLNIPVEARVAQLRAALERWRWLPRDLGPRYVLVNSAGFMLEAVEDGRPTLAMRTIIGRTYRATPSFAARLTHLVLNPYWTVPRSIAVKDLLPMQQKDSGFLQRKHIRVYANHDDEMQEIDPAEIDWSSLDRNHFPYRLRQDPGPKNSLGRIKFVMPNPYDIYLHDTPARGLFSLPVRTFSSGCVRVEKSVALAAWLLDQPDWPADRIQHEIDSGEQQWLRLPAPVPVYVVYWTVWVDDQGRVNFRNDIYKRDAALLAAFSH